MPGHGSESGTGWAWARMAARIGETWVIARGWPGTPDELETGIRSVPEGARIHPVVVEVPFLSGRRPTGEVSRFERIEYLLWQLRVLRTARRIVRAVHREPVDPSVRRPLHPDVPDVSRPVADRVEANARARDRIGRPVEEEELDARRVPAEEGEVDSRRARVRAERQRDSGPDLEVGGPGAGAHRQSTGRRPPAVTAIPRGVRERPGTSP